MSEIETGSTPEAPETPTYSEETISLMEKKGWDVDGMAKGYAELERFKSGINPDSVYLPTDQEDVEGWAKVYTAMGRPDSVDGYKFTTESKVEVDNDLVKRFGEFAYEKGLSQSQYNDILNLQLGLVEEATQAMEEAEIASALEAEAALKKEWKEDYDTRCQEAGEMAAKLGVAELLKKKGLAGDTEIIQMFDNLKQSTKEGHLPKPEAVSQPDSKQEMKDIQSNPAWMDRTHPEHKQLHARFLELCGVSR